MPSKTFFLPKGRQGRNLHLRTWLFGSFSWVTSLFWCFSYRSTPPDNLSIQEFQKNEAIDVEVNTCRCRPVCQHDFVSLPTSTLCSVLFRLSSWSVQRFYRLPISSPKTLLARSWLCSIKVPFTHSRLHSQVRWDFGSENCLPAAVLLYCFSNTNWTASIGNIVPISPMQNSPTVSSLSGSFQNVLAGQNAQDVCWLVNI